VAEYITIDDMEEYTPGFGSAYPITYWEEPYGWDSGLSGNGTSSVLGLVYPGSVYDIQAHAGTKAMYYGYDNSGAPFYSEINNHFTFDTNDWTIANVKMIALWFYGTAGNDANEQMYMGLEDDSGASSYAQVVYGDQGEDTDDIRVAEWQLWPFHR
jgi:hypothetical protein